MFGEQHALTIEELEQLHRGKTGALIETAVRLGCYAAGIYEGNQMLDALVEYAQNIGLAFQVIDDVLDCTQSAEQLGKSVGSDARAQKTTFMSFYDVENAKLYAKELTDRSISAIGEIENNESLIALAQFLMARDY